MDLGIINGQVYIKGRFEPVNVYVHEGVISKITNRQLEADKIIDASNQWVLPGFIDAHVHFELEVAGKLNRDDFYTGSILAAYGGVTTIVDFLKPVNRLEEAKAALKERLDQAKPSIVDYGFHMTLCDYLDSIEDLARWCIEQGVPTVKLFTTYGSTKRQTPDSTILKLLETSTHQDIRVHMHVENDGVIDESIGRSVSEHEKSRPAISEISEVIKLAEMIHYTKGYGYIVHTNCGSTLERLSLNYQELLGKHLFVESCPHYLLMNSSLYQEPEGYRYVMTPPLRSEMERQKLLDHFNQIHVIGTDHCPYLEEDKQQKFLDALPNGIEGLPYTFSSLFQLIIETEQQIADEVLRYIDGDENISELEQKIESSVLKKVAHLIDAMTINPAKIHGLYPAKGVIRKGSDGDFVIIDPSKRWSVEQSLPWFKTIPSQGCESPFAKTMMKGEILQTIRRGQIIVDRTGEIVDDLTEDQGYKHLKGSGCFIERKIQNG